MLRRRIATVFRGSWAGLLVVVAGIVAGPPANSRADDHEVARAPESRSRFREPVALAFSGDGHRLLVANRRGGSLTLIDARTGNPTAEYDIGRGLSDLVLTQDGKHLVVVDQGAGAVLLVDFSQNEPTTLARVHVGDGPSDVVLVNERLAVVSVTRGRRLVALRIEPGEPSGKPARLEVARTIGLPFPPRNLTALPDGRLIAADAERGRLALVDPSSGALLRTFEIPGHNIRGLTLSPDGKTLIVAHQSLRKLARTTFEDVHWGSLINNHLRLLSLDAIDSGADPLRDARTIDLGGTGNAAGDPGAVVFDRNGGLAVLLAGVDELALARRPGAALRRVSVGRRPTAVALAPDASAWYVADRLDDTITVIDQSTGVYRATIRLGPRPELSAAERGERLFYDAKLSHDGWMSCHSCHTDGGSSGLMADTLGDGSFGAPKRVPGLFGVGETAPYAWTGTVNRLEDQVRTSIESTMQGARPTDAQVADLTAYLVSLPFEPPGGGEGQGGDAARGAILFRERTCADCHTPPLFTSTGRFDVGLADERGNRQFNPPSLRGVGRRDPLLHDGRARSLEDVFRKARHPRDARYTDAEIQDLAAYLRGL